MAFIVEYVQDKAAGYLKTGIQAGGNMAGNAVGGVGSLIENGGRSFGEGVNGGIRGVGGTINGYGDGIKNMMAADGPVHSTKKTAVKPAVATRRPSGATQISPTTSSTKSTASGRPFAPVPRAGTSKRAAAAQPPRAGAKPLNGKAAGPTARRPKPAGASGLSKANDTEAPRRPVTNVSTTKSQAQGGKALDGKVRINPASRPKRTAKKGSL